MVRLSGRLPSSFRCLGGAAITILRRTGEKLAIFGAGVAIKKSLDYGFDYVAYPVALLWLGYGWGGALMTAASVVLNLATIRAYDWSRRDWLLIETAKQLREKPQGLAARPFVNWIVRKGDVPAFFILSWIEDPIVVTLYLRHGTHQFNGLDRRSLMIFWASTLTSNLLWILSLASVIEIFRRLL